MFVLVMSRSMFACWYHVGIYARDQSKQISSGSLLSSMLRHCYHLYPYPHMIYMIVSIHICICIDVYLYLYLCHIFASIYYSLNSGSPGLPHSEVGVKLKPEAVAFPFATWKRVPLFAVFQMDLALIV